MNRIRANKSISRFYRIGAFDTETKGGLVSDELSVYSISIGNKDYVGTSLDELRNDIEEISESLPKKTKLVIFVHNLLFDLRFLWKALSIDSNRCQDGLILSGSTPIQWIHPNKLVVFRESYQFLQSSLESAIDTYSCPIHKIDCSDIFSKTAEEYEDFMDSDKLERLKKHCIADTQSLQWIMAKFRDVSHSATGIDPIKFISMGSYAINCVKRFLPVPSVENPYFQYRKGARSVFLSAQPELIKLGQDCYHGGRTEVFRTDVCKNGAYYDFNSLYPSMMLGSLPTGRWHHHKSPDFVPDWNSLRNCAGGLIRATVYQPSIRYPLIPVSAAQSLVFCTGIMNVACTIDEIRCAEENLGLRVDSVQEVLYYEDSEPLFTQFVEQLYETRLKAKEDKNSALEKAVKIILNSSSGKLGQKYEQKRIRYHILSDEEKEMNPHELLLKFGEDWTVSLDLGIPRVEKRILEYSRKDFQIYDKIAHITARARILLTETLIRLGDCAYYSDTDSIVASRLNESKIEELLDEKRLGFLKREFFFEEFQAFAPKCYIYRDELGELHAKTKGTSKRQISEILKKMQHNSEPLSEFKEYLRRGTTPEAGYGKLGTILRTGKLFSAQTLQKSYSFDKARWKRDFSVVPSVPFELDEFVQRNS